MTPTRIPPADPKRQKSEGEPATVTTLADRLPTKGNPAPPEQGGTGLGDSPAAYRTPWTASPMVAIPQAKLEEILDKQDKLVKKLIELGEHSDRNSAAIVALRRLLQELLRRIENSGA